MRRSVEHGAINIRRCCGTFDCAMRLFVFIFSSAQSPNYVIMLHQQCIYYYILAYNSRCFYLLLDTFLFLLLDTSVRSSSIRSASFSPITSQYHTSQTQPISPFV